MQPNGSTRVARRAGRKHAANPATTTSITTAPNVHGSVGEIPQIWLANNRVAPKLANSPMQIPTTISAAPRFSIICKIWRCCAPNAMRTPISRVCSDTMYAMTLKTPMTTRSNAIAANGPDSVTPNSGVAYELRLQIALRSPRNSHQIVVGPDDTPGEFFGVVVIARVHRRELLGQNIELR
jgi:hypothetical protein